MKATREEISAKTCGKAARRMERRTCKSSHSLLAFLAASPLLVGQGKRKCKYTALLAVSALIQK